MSQNRIQEDFTGKRFGSLTVVGKSEQTRRNSSLWECRCDCGNTILLEPYKVRKELVSSCGCARKGKNTTDITGQRFGKLVAVRRLDEQVHHQYLWECRCDCGKIVKRSVNTLRSGNTKSCGCLRKTKLNENRKKYGIITDHVTLVDGTCVEKIHHQKLRTDNTSGHTGVQVCKNRWVATIGFKGKRYYLGVYQNLQDAIRARELKEQELYGPFLEEYYDEKGRKKEV